MGDRLGTPGGPGFDFRARKAAGRPPGDCLKRGKTKFGPFSKAPLGGKRQATVLKFSLQYSPMLLLYGEICWKSWSGRGGAPEAIKIASKRDFRNLG